jgi:hypothetical protein
MKYYTGIGTRDLSDTFAELIFGYANQLAQLKYTLRSGGAGGCDSAFELACDEIGGQKEIFIPWRKFSDNDDHISLDDLDKTLVDTAQTIAEQFHPSWQYLKFGARKLHTRNVFQVLGQDLQTPSEFVVCYTNDGTASGGTGQAMRIADAYNIPIYNIHNSDDQDKLTSICL